MTEHNCQKFYLAKRVLLTLFPTMVGSFDRQPSPFAIAAISHWNSLDRVAVTASTRFPVLEEEQKNVCDNLTAAFQNSPLNWNVGLQARSTPKHANDRPIYVVDTELRVTLKSQVDFVTGLEAVLGRDVALQVHIYGFTDGTALLLPNKEIQSSIMCPVRSGTSKVFCVDICSNFELNELLTAAITQNQRLRPGHEAKIIGKLDLVVVVDANAPRTNFVAAAEKKLVNKRILDEELGTDVVIVCMNGVEIKCHRSFLMANSPVFQVMFLTDMQEANTRKLQWPDVSENGAKAFLNYIYHRDTSKAEENCAVALQLLKTGHKYVIQSLEDEMRRLFLFRADTWYEMDVALKLFLFVHNFDAEWHLVKMKIVKALKKYAPMLRDSTTYQEIIRQNPEAAMQLVEYSLMI